MQDFLFYIPIGWKHIISVDALDHQLFILALAAVYTLKDIKKVLVLVTAFTVGHSATLALSVLNIIRFDSGWVEFLIPVTILVTAMSNLAGMGRKKRSVTVNYYLALGFGLIHGMGFANTIRMMLAKDQGIAMGLFSFNLGLEAGQVVVVAVILLAGYVVMSLGHVKWRDWVFFLSSGVFALALKMATERLPF